MAKRMYLVVLMLTFLGTAACGGGGGDSPPPATNTDCVFGTSTLDNCTLQ